MRINTSERKFPEPSSPADLGTSRNLQVKVITKKEVYPEASSSFSWSHKFLEWSEENLLPFNFHCSSYKRSDVAAFRPFNKLIYTFQVWGWWRWGKKKANNIFIILWLHKRFIFFPEEVEYAGLVCWRGFVACLVQRRQIDARRRRTRQEDNTRNAMLKH